MPQREETHFWAVFAVLLGQSDTVLFGKSYLMSSCLEMSFRWDKVCIPLPLQSRRDVLEIVDKMMRGHRSECRLWGVAAPYRYPHTLLNFSYPPI